MIKLINNEFIKVKKYKIILTYILIIISIILMNKYGKSDIKDMSYNLIPFIGIIISILFSGSICSEIENGTMRYYLTKPFKRYKIYLSKLITILIYVILSYAVITISVSIISNFDISYFKKYIIYMIPIMFTSSFIMYLSTTFKNHVFVSVFSILILCFSLIISQVLFGIKFNFIEYSFLPYLDYSLFNDKFVLDEMNKELGIHLSLNRAIIIDFIWFIIFGLLGILRFNSKDIRN